MVRRGDSRTALTLVIVFVGLVFFCLGWLIKANLDNVAPPQSLRLNGYQFIDPLLVCNVNNSNAYQEDKSLANQLLSIIKAHVQSGDISKASVYIDNLTNGKWANVDQSEQYYPSSLGKIPIMIAYYELAENSSSVLSQDITYPTGSQDLNQTQDIKPTEAIIPGQTYTVEELIEYMIKDSDNNATQLLYNNIDQDTLQNVYGQLGIPVNNNPTIANLDFITPQQIALLFRILYNATYLSRDYSEEALRVMSQSSFTQGIVAGMPSSTIVSHKLGLVGIETNGVVTEHELHDCGVVYGTDPYVICVMTRGSAPLPTLENILANISQATYKHVEASN